MSRMILSCCGDGIRAKAERRLRLVTINSSKALSSGSTTVALVRSKPGMKMKSFTFILNGKSTTVEVDPDKPLLWVLREDLGLTGTKYGCGMAICGCCTVHLDGDAVRSCVTPISRVTGKRVTTIEGLSQDLSHPVQRAWMEVQVPQCGFCQPGQMMSAACLLAQNPKPSDADIAEAMSGNLCRCGTYQRIRNAIHLAAEIIRKEPVKA